MRFAETAAGAGKSDLRGDQTVQLVVAGNCIGNGRQVDMILPEARNDGGAAAAGCQVFQRGSLHAGKKCLFCRKFSSMPCGDFCHSIAPILGQIVPGLIASLTHGSRV